MNAQELIYMARADTYTDTTQIPDTDGVINGKQVLGMLTYLNFAYRDLLSQITNQVNEDRYCDIFTINLNEGQCEYTIPVGSPSKPGLQNILGVSVNYTAPVVGTGTVSVNSGDSIITGVGTKFTQEFNVPQEVNINIVMGIESYRVVRIISDTQLKVYPSVLSTRNNYAFKYHRQDWQTCYPKRQSMLGKDIDYYIKNQPYSEPIFVAYDTSCFIYPQPPADIIGGLRMYGSIDAVPLVLTPSPTTPILDMTWHYVLPIAMKRYIFAAKGMLQEKNDAIAEYEREFNKVIKATMERELMSVEKQMPLLTQFQ